MRTRTIHRIVECVLITLTVLSLSLIGLALLGESISSSIAGVRFSSRTTFRPTLIALVTIGVTAAVSERRRAQYGAFWLRAKRASSGIAIVLTIATFAMGIRYGTFEAAAADQYGYVSQAYLWANGTLTIPQPLANAVPWPDADWTLSPLGYAPGQQRGTIVPRYPSGLPLMMAGLARLFGSRGVYAAVPLLGALAVGVTFLLATHVSDKMCGLMAMALLLSSPTFLFHLREPMSDVPVTAWWLLSLAFAIRGTALGAFGSGLAASAAVVTRPNLLPMIIPIALAAIASGSATITARLRCAALFALAVIPGCVLVALVNTTLYGSPSESGYGSLKSLFSVSYLSTNLQRYPHWLIQTETPFVCLAALAPWLLQTRNRRWLAALFLATSIVCFACYVFYLPFDSWTYLRFLLPAIPLLLILSSAVTLMLIRRRLSSTSARLVTAALVLLLAWRWDTSVSHGFTVTRPQDRRFETVGIYVRDQLPSNAIVFTMMHSGSIRFYSQRTTIRWDVMDADWLDRAVGFLRDRGYHSYLVLDDFERAQFQRRFSGHSPLSELSWMPNITPPGATMTAIYDLSP